MYRRARQAQADVRLQVAEQGKRVEGPGDGVGDLRRGQAAAAETGQQPLTPFGPLPLGQFEQQLFAGFEVPPQRRRVQADAAGDLGERDLAHAEVDRRLARGGQQGRPGRAGMWHAGSPAESYIRKAQPGDRAEPKPLPRNGIGC